MFPIAVTIACIILCVAANRSKSIGTYKPNPYSWSFIESDMTAAHRYYLRGEITEEEYKEWLASAEADMFKQEQRPSFQLQG